MTASTLIRHETSLGEAITNHDVALLAKLIHPSFTYFGTHRHVAVRWSRNEWLRSVLSLQTNSFCHNATDVMIAERVHGVVGVEATWLGLIAGASIQEPLLMSDFWLKSSGAWRLLRRHASLSPKPAHYVEVRDESVLL